MKHLTDRELIDYTVKFDDDPIRIRLAKIMDNTQGHLLDGLAYAGMDRETWLFENTYDPGQYIQHLESELDIYHDENRQLREELKELKARTVMDLIAELKQEIKTADWMAEEARRERDKLQGEHDRMRDKMKVWRALSTDVT